MKSIPGIEAGVSSRIEALGMEVVQLEWGGSRRKPVLRVRVDFPDSTPGHGVTVKDCARASRALEEWLDEHAEVPEKYVLEVSSPGVERPLSRRRDFVRFAGSEIEVRPTQRGTGKEVGRIHGVLEGVEGDDESYSVVIRTGDESRILMPRGDIDRAKLVFHWKDES